QRHQRHAALRAAPYRRPALDAGADHPKSAAGTVMGTAFLVVVFAGIFIAPLVWGSFIVAEDADMGTLNGWFGFATAIFIIMALFAIGFIATHPLQLGNLV